MMQHSPFPPSAEGITVEHELKTRVRLHAPMLRGSYEGCCALREALVDEPGVRDVAASPVTGSVVVRYDPEAMPRSGLFARIAAILRCLSFMR